MKTILVCNHSLDGWCLACVKLLAEKADQMIGDLEEQVSKEHMDWVELRNNYNTVERQRDKARSRAEAAEGALVAEQEHVEILEAENKQLLGLAACWQAEAERYQAEVARLRKAMNAARIVANRMGWYTQVDAILHNALEDE